MTSLCSLLSELLNTLLRSIAQHSQVEPTVEPTIKPTVEPTVKPTVEPTVEPTIEPTAETTVDIHHTQSKLITIRLTAMQINIQSELIVNFRHHSNLSIYTPPRHLGQLEGCALTLSSHFGQSWQLQYSFCNTLDRTYEYAQAMSSLDFDNVKSNKSSSNTPGSILAGLLLAPMAYQISLLKRTCNSTIDSKFPLKKDQRILK
jgi:hypothetical protein